MAFNARARADITSTGYKAVISNNASNYQAQGGKDALRDSFQGRGTKTDRKKESTNDTVSTEHGLKKETKRTKYNAQ